MQIGRIELNPSQFNRTYVSETSDYYEHPRFISHKPILVTHEAAKFLDAFKSTRMSALFIFALTTGMRPQEYLALKWSDINLSKGTVTVRRAIVWSQKKGVGWHFDEPKTSRSR
jgi:integrase